MSGMKAVLVGLGNFGSGWYKRLRRHAGVQAVCVVEANAQLRETIDPETPFYSSLEDAIISERPDFVINVTPPHIHTAINEIAFAHGLPVLCEKPISNDIKDAQYIVGQAERKHIPFMISENYRFFAPVLKAKELLDSGVIGKMSSVHIEFDRYHVVPVPYFGRLANGLLEDVTIHHFDMIRYFTGQEAVKVFAKNSNPPGSWTESTTIHLTAWMELDGGTVVDYHGNMMAKGKQTEWYGDWRFEGAEGAISITSNRVKLMRDGMPDEVYTFEGVGDLLSLDEFLAALKQQREPKPSGRDYLKSQSLVHAAAVSSRKGITLTVEEALREA
ncbi:Gfo/Idh/MocA family protein [Paenibacillus arenilitoris]|uniref:Gfo/Idh/MocA family oxidoreductase n=1 Tax=Paenibacillus arenilitoris TaxID=2772299 RepID=A0A927H961_9BACL|nr:Gfo/Idh/MocA family oxidoreductase [Paenibacillus arenilitoris]MBD2872297.1 Gfo/Idh/MocA family oxidoreductase [Paenibacillus arenilitoris]